MHRCFVYTFVFALAICALAFSVPALAQATGTLRGQVTDPSGAVVVSATVSVTSATGQTSSTTTNKQGTYELKNLAPGKYSLTATAQGFSAYQLTDVNVPAAVQQLDIALDIAVKKEQVVVSDESTTVGVSPETNASATVLKDKDLEALSDDPDELASDLQALAGPSAGPNGGQIYIDGFTDGTLPPKASIREIRINQNPFSAQYDRLGYGRIEVFTKPGSDKWHGQVMVQSNTKALNAANPYAVDTTTGQPLNIPDYTTMQYAANVSGALSKKASLFFNIERRNIDDSAVVNATVPTDSDLLGNQIVSTPRHRTNLSPRFDYQLSQNNTLTARYQYLQNYEDNNGVGQLTLASQGYNTKIKEHTLQISDTQVLSPTVINETRFQYIRNRTDQLAISSEPTINVQGNFNGGGNSQQQVADLADRFEVQNYTSMQRGKHLIKFGGRLRSSRQSDILLQHTNGSYVFDGSLSRANDPALSYSDAALLDYTNGTPSRYTLTVASTGTPIAHLSYVDAGLYAEDDWRVRPNLTLSYGVRYETQNQIGDHADFAPRIGFSWGLGSSKSTPKTVLRAGWGMFYDRFTQSNLLAIEHSSLQQQYTLQFTDPNSANLFYNQYKTVPPTEAELSALGVNPSTANRTQAASGLQAPYTMQAAVTLERQLGKIGTASATYLNSRGVHQLLTINANAPYLTGYDPNLGTITTYESEGIFKQNQVIVNTNLRVSTKVSLNSFYSLSYADATASTASNSANPKLDYGRASFDVRNRFFLGGSIALPYLVRVSPFIVVNSGAPYNVTAGQDYNGDNVLNDRPVYANAATTASDLINTPCGAVDVNPAHQSLAGTKVIPVNCGSGPMNFTFNMRFSKTFGIGRKLSRESAASADANSTQGGPRGGGGRGLGGGGAPGGGLGPRGMGGLFASSTSDRRYNLTLTASVRNLFNHVNSATPIGVLTSPEFGRSIALAGGPFSSGSAYNRRIELQLTFAF